MIPAFKMFFKPMLVALQETGGPMQKRDVECRISEILQLTKTDKRQTTKSNIKVITDRINWASVYLIKAGMVYRPKRGFLQITNNGIELLSKGYDIITNEVLGKYSEEFSKYQYMPKHGVNDMRLSGNRKK